MTVVNGTALATPRPGALLPTTVSVGKCLIFSNLTPVVAQPEEEDKVILEKIDDEDQEELENAPPSEKQAMQKWKSEDSRNCLKHQRRLLNEGVINSLPWEKYLDDVDDADDATKEALKWAEEQEAKKKEMISWMEREGSQQIKKSKEQ